MKIQLTILAFILGFTMVNAQETENPIQKNQFNFSKNFKPFRTNYDGVEMKNYTFGYQRNINEDLSLGINLNFDSSKGIAYEKYNDNIYQSNQLNYQSKGISFNFNYDWSRIIGMNTKKFDLYTGTSVGVSVIDNYLLERSPTNGLPTGFSKYTSNEYFIGGHLGFRYWITKNIGISTELNKSFYDSRRDQTASLSLGLNYKF
jgi:hypothetical protein